MISEENYSLTLPPVRGIQAGEWVSLGGAPEQGGATGITQSVYQLS